MLTDAQIKAHLEGHGSIPHEHTPEVMAQISAYQFRAVEEGNRRALQAYQQRIKDAAFEEQHRLSSLWELQPVVTVKRAVVDSRNRTRGIVVLDWVLDEEQRADYEYAVIVYRPAGRYTEISDGWSQYGGRFRASGEQAIRIDVSSGLLWEVSVLAKTPYGRIYAEPYVATFSIVERDPPKAPADNEAKKKYDRQVADNRAAYEARISLSRQQLAEYAARKKLEYEQEMRDYRHRLAEGEQIRAALLRGVPKLSLIKKQFVSLDLVHVLVGWHQADEHKSDYHRFNIFVREAGDYTSTEHGWTQVGPQHKRKDQVWLPFPTGTRWEVRLSLSRSPHGRALSEPLFVGPENRMGALVEAILTWTGRKTRTGKPWVVDLRRSGFPMLNAAERDEAFARAQQTKE